MYECEYSKTVRDQDGNTKTVRIPPFEECLTSIKERYNNAKRENEALQKENKRLRDAHYESEELQKMQQECARMIEELDLGFPITKKEDEKIRAWAVEHSKKCHDGHGTFKEYIFTSTELGLVGTVKCGVCGEEFDFREIE